MKIGLIGYGDFGRQVEQLVRQVHKDAIFFYFDDNCCAKKTPRNIPFSNFLDEKYATFYFVVTLGYKHLPLKLRIYNELLMKERRVLSCVHPTAIVDQSAVIEAGAIIFPGCNIGMNVMIKTGVVLYNGVIIAHDGRIGKSAFLAPGVTVAGNVTIGDCTFVGTGVSIANNLKVGDHCVVGIGTVLTETVGDGCSVIGNPQRILNSRLHLE